MNRFVVIPCLLAAALVTGRCGSPPNPTVSGAQPTQSWHLATVLPPDETAFRAAAIQSGWVIGDKSAWARDDRAAWIPAELVDEGSRIGLVRWKGRLVSWADGGLIRTSRDGLSWEDAVVGPDESNPSTIVVFVDQLLLLGQGTKRPIGAWRSGDGSTWTAIDGAPMGIWAAVDAGGRGLVAVGSRGPDPAVWTTADGTTWVSAFAPEREGEETSALYGVAAGPSGVLAIGDAGGRATAWSSSDAVSWTQSPDSFGQDAFLASVSNVRGIFLIAGRRHDRPAIWSSPDGRSWSSTDLPTPDAGPAEADAVSLVDDSLVVFGYSTKDAGNGGSSRIGYLVWTLKLTR